MVIIKLNEESSILSKARKLFVMDTLKYDDYSELKKESLANSKCLKRELKDIDVKLKSIQEQSQLESRPFVDVFQGFSSLDTANKRHLVNLIPPIKVNFQTGDISLQPNSALSKILTAKKQQT